MSAIAFSTSHRDGDSFALTRRLSRRGSSYGGQQPFPYDDHHSHGGMYTEPMMTTALQGEGYARPEYQMYGHGHSERGDRRSYYPQAYDERDMPMGRDSYYPEDGMPMMPMSTGSRHRRASSVGPGIAFDMRGGAPPMDPYRRPSSIVIKLKPKGAYRSGLTIGDAQSNVRLSGNDAYTFRDLNADMRGRIAMKIRWAGYPSLTYDIPLDGYGDRVNLQTLARRTARAVVHFLQTNIIPIHWDSVEMLRLEEVSPGTWQPVLAVR
ncbi:hypothetical protein HWV62_36081 [Athelia sp. TMB]|nr:hypothetical protein HWV62_36081 [Athelia sp. TMB]